MVASGKQRATVLRTIAVLLAVGGCAMAIAVGSMLIPFSLYLGGLRRLDPTRAVVTSCLEPVFAIAFAALLPGRVGGMASSRRSHGSPRRNSGNPDSRD